VALREVRDELPGTQVPVRISVGAVVKSNC
jgi:hypothetical protein